MSASGSKKVVLFALFSNLGIAAAKFAGALFSGSASLLAEAIHSLVDCLNQALLLVGHSRSSLPPTEKHPLGHGREAFFWSFIVAILLFSLGGLFAIYEGIHKISEMEPMSSPWLAFGILGFSVVLEGFSFRACLHEIREKNTFGSLWAWFRHSTSADVLVIFIEDAAALVGLTVAFASLLVAWITGNPAWDAYGSIAVGTVLVVVAILLAVEIKSLLIGEAPSENLRAGIEPIVAARIPGGKVLRLIALQTGASEVMLSYKVSPGEIRGADELVRTLNEIEREVRLKFPQVKWQFVEPDFYE